MKGLFIPDITAEMFRSGCLESIEALMAEGEIYDIDYEPEQRMTELERKKIMNLADTILGEINRMCVTKELAELDTMYGHAKRNIDNLLNMIYDARFKI